MAHEITKKDGAVYALKAAWHGLGIVLPQATTMLESLKIAGLDWEVETWEISANKLGESGFDSLDVKEARAVVRMDTRDVLGVVGHNFTPVQNTTLAGIIDNLSVSGHIPKAESVLSMRGGREVAFLARLGSFFSDDDGRDEVVEYLLIANGHTGTRSLTVLPTTIRVVCRNTLEAATTEGEARGIARRVIHRPSAPDKVEQIAKRIIDLRQKFEKFEELTKALRKRTLKPAELAEFFATAYASVRPSHGAGDRARDIAKAQMKQWAVELNRPDNVLAGPGSAWQALNVVTAWVDHAQTDTKERAYRNLLGAGRAAKANVLAAAIKTLG